MARRLARCSRGLTHLLVAAVIVGVTTSATATVIYQYLGNPYVAVNDEPTPEGTYTTGMRVEAWFEFDEPIAPGNLEVADQVLRYEVTDGRVTMDETNSDLSLEFIIDPNGVIASHQLVVNSVPIPGPLGSQLSWVNSGGGFLEFAVVQECIAAFCSGETLTGDEWSADVANAINQVGGGGWSIVPEPSASLLLGLGLIGLRWARASRR